jgi:hypothetical protein
VISFEANPTEKAGAEGLAASGAAAWANCETATQQIIEQIAAVSAARERGEILAIGSMTETSRLARSGRAAVFKCGSVSSAGSSNGVRNRFNKQSSIGALSPESVPDTVRKADLMD